MVVLTLHMCLLPAISLLSLGFSETCLICCAMVCSETFCERNRKIWQYWRLAWLLFFGSLYTKDVLLPISQWFLCVCSVWSVTQSSSRDGKDVPQCLFTKSSLALQLFLFLYKLASLWFLFSTPLSYQWKKQENLSFSCPNNVFFLFLSSMFSGFL